jgi:uncharacterized protein (TIGR03437 family)
MLSSILVCFSALALSAGTPVATYGTYFGGSGDTNAAVAVAVDPTGNVIVAGYTTSQTLPGTAKAFQPTKATGFPDNRDVFIAKFDPLGQTLLWATFLGGAGDDITTAVAVDSAGSIHIIGTTTSSNFPVTSGAYLRSPVSSSGVIGFASKISADGTSLLYSTLLPGGPNAVSLNNAGEAYLVGAFAATVITPGALGAGINTATLANDGAFLLCLNSAGGLVFGAYLGGDGFTGSKATSLAISPQGNIYVAGVTFQSNILTTANAFQRNYTGTAGPTDGPGGAGPGIFSFCCANGFLVEVNSTGSQLLYGTYFGPQYSGTAITGVALASNGSVYLSGNINTTALWATAGAYLSAPSPGFAAKLTPGTLVLDAFTYVPAPPLLEIGNQPEVAYLTFDTPGVGPTEGIEVAELSLPPLTLTSSFRTPFQGFAPSVAVVAPPHSIWLAGSCGSPCSLGSLISSNAFESVPSSATGTNAVLIQLSDISPSISIIASSSTGTSPFAAGQLISIYGTQLGPSQGSSAQEGSNGVVTNSNAGTQVLFDGVAAPILYASSTQVNTAIPCAVAGHPSTQIVVSNLGAQSPTAMLPLSAAAPGIFTANGTGTGQAAILNQHGSLNGPSNPAPRGSEVVLYATGIGPTSPCVDGQIYQSNFPSFAFPVIVGVANIGAEVVYAGQAPYLVSGVAQINFIIPSEAPIGVVPLNMEASGVFSPPGVTIAVK